MTSIASEIFDLDPGVHLVTLSGPQAALQGVFVSLALLELGGGEPASDNAPERHKILRGPGESWKVEVGSNVKLLISVVAPTPEIRSTLAVTVEALADRSGGPPDEHGRRRGERAAVDRFAIGGSPVEAGRRHVSRCGLDRRTGAARSHRGTFDRLAGLPVRGGPSVPGRDGQRDADQLAGARSVCRKSRPQPAHHIAVVELVRACGC